MASNKFLELQEFTDADLEGELAQLEVQYQKLRFDHALKGLDNPLNIREMRRDIARVQTEIRRREVAAMDEAGLQSRSKIRTRRSKGK
ncbi:MAG: 50S ribosomal protein L29 [Saprospiraceae bacterium]|nr:50S ribosomal protein L29 [Saprospiraceae bacterium]HRD80870.1 50S ribosomal protein L29 [Saprospiraceae bacterium]HRF40221.1 50S ribosomal protein L29 [Saprospiraceae bacterium]HRJ13606.1 50S ribosomal protein L29 [Saprospiraceae bacterium]HRK83216.1 50S ribosomal protein L29 [Saprospiraceae bacterium]